VARMLFVFDPLVSSSACFHLGNLRVLSPRSCTSRIWGVLWIKRLDISHSEVSCRGTSILFMDSSRPILNLTDIYQISILRNSPPCTCIAYFTIFLNPAFKAIQLTKGKRFLGYIRIIFVLVVVIRSIYEFVLIACMFSYNYFRLRIMHIPFISKVYAS
jgi:hypothetical protein